MQLFWVKDFEATSLDELLAVMKIGRQSLYDTFGDKRALFMEAPVQYRELVESYVRGCLADAGRRRRVRLLRNPDRHLQPGQGRPERRRPLRSRHRGRLQEPSQRSVATAWQREGG